MQIGEYQGKCRLARTEHICRSKVPLDMRQILSKVEFVAAFGEFFETFVLLMLPGFLLRINGLGQCFRVPRQ